MTSIIDAERARGMPTNGERKPVDWLNHTRSLADVREPKSERYVQYELRRVAREWAAENPPEMEAPP